MCYDPLKFIKENCKNRFYENRGEIEKLRTLVKSLIKRIQILEKRSTRTKPCKRIISRG